MRLASRHQGQTDKEIDRVALSAFRSARMIQGFGDWPTFAQKNILALSPALGRFTIHTNQPLDQASLTGLRKTQSSSSWVGTKEMKWLESDLGKRAELSTGNSIHSRGVHSQVPIETHGIFRAHLMKCDATDEQTPAVKYITRKHSLQRITEAG